MLLLDRYIFARFIVNFIILFALVFAFAAAIDLTLNLDRFVELARRTAGPDASVIAVFFRIVRMAIDFELPRLFQFYAFLHGLVAVGAMAFTLANMLRHRELLAMLASGVSLHRIALPFFFAVFILSILQLLNQEFMLPRVAPLLLRDHAQVGLHTVRDFPIALSKDSQGHLLQAPSFDPAGGVLVHPTIIERDERGLMSRRITADRAVWDADNNAWLLTNGSAVRIAPDRGLTGMPSEVVESFATDLDPRVLTVRRHSKFASMLSMRQIDEMLEMGTAADSRMLLRYRYARFATVLVNLLVLALALPSFLLREPANLLNRAIICAAVTIPAMLGAAVGMMADLPGIAPLASVFLPVVILAFVALVPWTFFKT